MNSTAIALLEGYAAVAGFALFLLPAGFLLGHWLNLNRFRERSPAEQLLWSLCLSLPIVLQITVTLGRVLPRAAILTLLLILAAAALATLALRARPTTSSKIPTAPLAIAALIGLYLVFACTDLEYHHRLYVSTVLYDWSVRIPMVEAAMRSGVPPINGLSSLTGHPAPLRYFYFWYVLCADLATLLHLPARAVLAASCVWSAWSLLSVFFLALKYLLGQTRRPALALLPLAIMGLDLIPTVPLFLLHKLHPYPEIEWWHQDRTPSLLSAVFYAPHHVAAYACLLTGILILALAGNNRRESITAGLFAGLAFASASGTALLPTILIAIVCLVWSADLLRQRRFHTVAALAISAVTALLLAHTFLHELGSTDGAASGPPILLRWRNEDFVLLYMAKYHAITTHPWHNHLLAQPAVLLIHLFDLGFFAFVLHYRIRRDKARTLSPGERTLWAIFLGTLIPYLFLSSASIASPNDLGVDAGFLLRLTLQLWAAAWLCGSPASNPGALPFSAVFSPKKVGDWRRRLAIACAILGLSAQIFQIVWQRIYFPLVASQTLHKPLDILTTDHLSTRLYNIREANRSLNAMPTTASIQYNPIGPMQPALTFYATHQIAAFDRGCGTGYGGDYRLCQTIMPALVHLYGNTNEGFERGKASNDRQDAAAPTVATAADALAACRTLDLSALIAESTDSIWSKPTSWVWTLHPTYANPTVRVFTCPKP